MDLIKREKIVVDFTRIENIVIANVVNTPADIIGYGTIIEDEGFVIKSVNYRDLNDIILYLHGKLDAANDHLYLVTHAFKNAEEAKDAIERFKSLIHKYNSRNEEDDTTIAWERAE